jgi:four helix bundle protein
MTKITSFSDLVAWQQAHQLALHIYKTSRQFPKNERFSLMDQMRRSAVSITSNIAEGFSRKTRYDKIWFYFVSKGSLTELQNQLLIAKDVKYISIEKFDKIARKTNRVHKLINGLIKTAATKK